jgi:hypothetical protein
MSSILNPPYWMIFSGLKESKKARILMKEISKLIDILFEQLNHTEKDYATPACLSVHIYRDAGISPIP